LPQQWNRFDVRAQVNTTFGFGSVVEFSLHLLNWSASFEVDDDADSKLITGLPHLGHKCVKGQNLGQIFLSIS